MEIIPYFTMGYPDDSTVLAALKTAIRNGVHKIELGYPSPDPKYDGPGIKRTHLGNPASIDSDYPEIFSELREHGISYYALLYYSDVCTDLDYSLRRLKELGFKGLILPDLLIDYFSESKQIITHIQGQSLEFVPFFTQATPDAVIREVSRKTRSWIYYGLQPSTGIIVPLDFKSVGRRVGELLAGRNVVYGFGIRGTRDVELLRNMGAYGAAVGSAFVEHLRYGDMGSIAELLKEMGGAASA